MPVPFHQLHDIMDSGFDTVIDVRSPAEFAEDHIPGAINLPALSNDERAAVGTIYKQVSPFAARKIGAAIVARNVAAHIEGPLALHDGDWRPLVYCWRGGQRSGSFASILAQIGWRTETVEGGYQQFRRLVHAALYESTTLPRVILLDGNTGTAKTEVLQQLATLGVQVVDLEGLAQHRGSLLGDMPGGQPAQKAFETRLATALVRLDPARPVVIEAESSKIGRLNLPPVLWQAMCAAPRIEVMAPVPARAAYLTRTYAGIIADPDRLAGQLNQLRVHRGHAVVDGWIALLLAGDHPGLARALIVDHYDPAYAKSRAIHAPRILARVGAEKLDAAGQAGLVAEVARIVSGS